jgi:hypothetical protein
MAIAQSRNKRGSVVVREVDQPNFSDVFFEEAMKSTPPSIWTIIESLQRRLERQGISGAAADRAVAEAIRLLVRRPTYG